MGWPVFRATLLPVLLLAAAYIQAGCAPAFQDARVVPPGQVEITPSFSGAGFSAEGESEYFANTFGAQIHAGAFERLSLGIGYARFESDEGDGGINAVAFGPKIGLIPDRVALAVPASVSFGEDVPNSWALQPTALITVPLSPRLDLNPSVRLLIPLCDDCEFNDSLVGLNAGLGWHASPRVIVRPEAGILVNPGETGVVWTFGLGVSILAGAN